VPTPKTRPPKNNKPATFLDWLPSFCSVLESRGDFECLGVSAGVLVEEVSHFAIFGGIPCSKKQFVSGVVNEVRH